MLDELPDAKTLIGDIAQGLGDWTYLLVGLLAFLETGAFVGLVAPGETVVIAGGVIAGQGEISLLVLIGIVWACAFLGDTTSFFIGRRLGRDFILRHGPKLKITEERLEQVERFFQRHGGKTILIGRFVGLVRALAPFIAGSSGLSYGRFAPYSVIGTGLWATVFSVLGLRLLRVVRPGRARRRPGDVRARRHDRGDRRAWSSPGGDCAKRSSGAACPPGSRPGRCSARSGGGPFGRRGGWPRRGCASSGSA